MALIQLSKHEMLNRRSGLTNVLRFVDAKQQQKREYRSEVRKEKNI